MGNSVRCINLQALRQPTDQQTGMWGYREVTLPIVKSFKDCNNYDQKLQFLTSYKNYYLPMLIILRRTIEGGGKVYSASPWFT